MTLPKNLTADDIVKVIVAIDAGHIVVPPKREPTKYVVKRDQGKYPPKFLISKAYELLTGSEWSDKIFGGGPEANDFLIKLGFDVWDMSSEPPQKMELGKSQATQ